MTRWLLTAVWAVIALLAIGEISTFVHAQRAEKGTQTWTIGLPGSFSTGDGVIHVVDTNGVCLYVWIYGDRGAMSAVSKSTLPMGTGCQ